MKLILENLEEVSLPEPSIFVYKASDDTLISLLMKFPYLPKNVNYGTDEPMSFDEMKKRLETELDVTNIEKDGKNWRVLFNGAGSNLGVGVYFDDTTLYLVSGLRSDLYEMFKHEVLSFDDAHGFIEAIFGLGTPRKEAKLEVKPTVESELSKLNSLLAEHFSRTDLSVGQREEANPYKQILG